MAKGLKQRRMAPAMTDEGREKELISLAIDLAEKQLRDGTASSSVITHFLKLGSTEKKKEMQILDKQVTLMDAKTENLQASKRIEELYEKAIDAMKEYSGDDEAYEE